MVDTMTNLIDGLVTIDKGAVLLVAQVRRTVPHCSEQLTAVARVWNMLEQ